MTTTAPTAEGPAVPTSAPQHPAADAFADDAPTGPLTSAPQSRRRGRRRTAALLLCGAVLCSGTGAATAVLLDDDQPVAAPSAGTARSSGTVQPASSTSGGTAQTAAATIAPSVVTIAVTSRGGAGPLGRAQATSGTGSGIVLRSDGTILTNHHVVAGATAVTVTAADGTTAPASVVGSDPSSDLAVLRAEGLDLPAAVFADSDELAVGQSVLAVGAPLGLSNTVTEGIVSTLDRPVRTGDSASEQSVIDAVQTDAAINPGNSGGALVDLAGRVVGVNSAIATAGSGSSGNIGVGFAIPSNEAVEVAEQLVADGTADHALLGVGVREPTSGTADGAVLTGVTAGGPAAAAGLEVGDVVTQVGDRVVGDADGLVVAVRDHAPGTTVEVTFTRDGRERTTSATLASTD